MPAFSLVSWLKQQLDGPAWKRRRSRQFFQPQLFVLEDRVAPAAFTVNTLTDTNVKDFATGTDATGHVSLRSAIQTANHLGLSNTISLPSGTYDLSLGQLNIRNNLTLTGMGASNTTINAQFTSRILQVFNGFTVAMNKVTMENGGVQGAAGSVAVGGAIFDSGALALNNDTLFQNLALGGAGADGAPGSNGTDATITTGPTDGGAGGNGQRGGDAKGGAIYVDNSPGAALSVVNCVFTSNEAFQGQGGSGGQGGQGGFGEATGPGGEGPTGANGGAGGNGGQGGNAFGGSIYNAGGSLVIQGSTFSGNFAGVFGFLFGTIAGGGGGGVGGAGPEDQDLVRAEEAATMAATVALPDTTREVRSTTLPQEARPLLPAPSLRIAPSERRVVKAAQARAVRPTATAPLAAPAGQGVRPATALAEQSITRAR
jgi:hypothetical protein